MYQIFQKCNRQRHPGDSANVVGGYEDPFRKRYSTSHRPKKNFNRCNQASRIPEHDADEADEFTDDKHIVIDVWPPSSVSTEVTWNRPNVATCTATSYSTGSHCPAYSSTCTMESSNDQHRSQIIDRRERSISPDARWSPNVRCSPNQNQRGCSDARIFPNANVGWPSFAQGSRKEPSPAVTRWFPEPPDPRWFPEPPPRWLPAPAAHDPHGGRWSQPSAPIVPSDVRYAQSPCDTREPPDFTWLQSSPSTLPSSLDTVNRGNAAPPSTFYPANQQVRNVSWKSGSTSHSDRFQKGVLGKKDSLLVLDSTASSSDSDCPPLNRRPLHSRGQRKGHLNVSLGNSLQKGEKSAKCTADAGSLSEHHSTLALGLVDSSSSCAFRSSPQTDGGKLEHQASNVDTEQLCVTNKKQDHAPCDKDGSIAPLQVVVPCQDAPSRMKHSARKSTGGGYKKHIDLKAQKFFALTPDRKGFTSCTLKEPLVVIKKVCTGFPTPDAPKCDPIVVSSSSFVLPEHSANADDQPKSVPSDNSVVADDPLRSKSVSSDHSFLAEPSKCKVGRPCKSVRSGRSSKAKRLMPITDDDSVIAVPPPETIPSADCVSPERSVVGDSYQSSSVLPMPSELSVVADSSSVPPVILPEPPNIKEPLALSEPPIVELVPTTLGADYQQPSSLELTSRTRASTVSVIAGPQQPEPSSVSIGSNLEQIVQHLKRRAEIVAEESVSTKKRRWNRMPPCSPLADPLPPFPTSRSSARLSKKNKYTCPSLNNSTDTSGALVCVPVTSSSRPSFVSEPSTSCKVSVIQGEYAITHINGSPYMALEDRDNWHLQADPLHYDMSLEMCMPSPPVCAWTKDMTDAEVQVEAVTPTGYDKEELDSYIKAKLDESLAKDLNIKLQHMKKLIDRVLQEKERLEKAHKNAIIKIQSLMRTTLKPSVLDKATSTIGLQSPPKVLAPDNSTADSSRMEIRKRNIGVQCEMMLSRQRKRTRGVQTEGLVAFEVLNCSYVDKQKGKTSATAPRNTRYYQAEELPVEPLCVDDGISVPETEVSTAAHKWLATKNKNSCARCIRVNHKFTASVCARCKACDVNRQPASGNPLHRPPTGGIMKALWKLWLFLTKLPVHQLFLDRFTTMMANFFECTSSIFQGEVEPKLAEPVLQMLEQCNEAPGLATYLLGQKLQELCNLLVRLCKLHSYLSRELNRSFETLHRMASDTLNLVVLPQHHTQAKDDDPLSIDIGSISCSVVSSPCGSDMENDSSADDMDFSHDSSESSSSESESCTQESSARTIGKIHVRASVSRNVENSCAIAKAPVEANELTCSSTGNGNVATGSPTIKDSLTAKFAGSTVDSSISTGQLTSGDAFSDKTLRSMERVRNNINGEVTDSSKPMYTGDHLTRGNEVIQQSPVYQAIQTSPNPFLALANPDKLNVLLTHLCKQLNDTHQRLIANRATATNSSNSSNVQVPTVMPAQSSVAQSPLGPYVNGFGLIPPLLPVTHPSVVTNSISMTTNLTSTSIATSVTPTTIGTSAGVRVIPCVASASSPPYSGVKVTLCNTNDASSIASAVNVLARAVALHSTVADAVNEIFSKTQSVQNGQIKTGSISALSSPLLSLLAKNNPKFSPQGQPKSAQPASDETLAKSPSFHSLRIITPKSGRGFHSLSSQAPLCGGDLPVKNISIGGSPTTAQISDNQCGKNQENIVTHTTAVDTSRLFSQKSPEGQQNSMDVSASMECPAIVSTSKTASSAEKCQTNCSQMSVLSIEECSKSVDTSKIPETSSAVEIYQQRFSQTPVVAVAECNKTVNTSEVLPGTSSATEKCQQDVSLLPVEQSEAVKTPEILSQTAVVSDKRRESCSSMLPAWSTAEHSKNVNSSEILSTATKCKQNSSLPPVSSAIEQSKTVDTSKILPLAAEAWQKDSNSTTVASSMEQSQTVQMPQTPSTIHSREVETSQQLSRAASVAERYQQNLSTASGSPIASQSVSDTPKTLPSIILPLAAPLVSPSTAKKHSIRQDLPLYSVPDTQPATSAIFRKSTAIPVGHLSSMPHISPSLTTPHISPSLTTPHISPSLTTPHISPSLTTTHISPALTTPASPVPSPVTNATNTYHQPTTLVARDSHEQCTSQPPKTVSFPTSASLKLFATLMSEGIVIKWTFAEEFISYENQVVSYELFVHVGKEQETSSKVLSWILLGKILPLPLPMAVTLTNYVRGESYTFLVKAVFKNCARHIYSNPGKVQL